ncbi:MAG: peptide chain release factor 2, partial [Verrucomicrobia bacterium]
MSSKPSWPPPVRNLPTCGGFFDVARVQKRLGDLDAEMAKETFW